jgi:ribosomal protein S18 acetylase RimI-like enzyme
VSAKITLRRGAPADAAAIQALTRAAYAKWIPLIGREPLPMTVDYAEALKLRRFDLLEEDGALAALIETVPQDGWLLIENVAVRPGAQGRGFGARLLTLAEEIARQAGLAGVRLYTNKAFEANVRLYRSFGYLIEREEGLSDGGTAVHMAKGVE